MMKTDITAEEIVSILHDMGYRASCEQEGSDVIVHSASQGFMWNLNICDLNESEASDFLLFSHVREVNPVLFPVGRICNEFNREAPHGVATFIMFDDEDLTNEALITVELSVSLHGGVSEDWVRSQITGWDFTLGMFDKKVRECEEPSKDDLI